MGWFDGHGEHLSVYISTPSSYNGLLLYIRGRSWEASTNIHGSLCSDNTYEDSYDQWNEYDPSEDDSSSVHELLAGFDCYKASMVYEDREDNNGMSTILLHTISKRVVYIRNELTIST